MPTFIASPGEEFIVQYTDRQYGSGTTVPLKVDNAGVTYINGSRVLALTTGQVGTSSLAAGAVTAAKLASNAVTTVKITDANVTTAKLAPSGVTGAKLATTFMKGYGFVGRNGAGSITLTGAVVGDRVVAVINNTDGSTASSLFEAAITVGDAIQQSSATDLSAKKFSVILIAASA